MATYPPADGAATADLTSLWYNATFFPGPGEDHELEREDAMAMDLCLMCNNQGIRTCGRCKARYCSQVCQQKDWPMHKLVCKLLATHFKDSNCPRNHFRAILLPQNQSKPEFLWIKTKPEFLWIKTKPDADHFNGIDNVLSHDLEHDNHRQDDLSISIRAININASIANRRCGRGLSFDVLACNKPSIEGDMELKLNECVARLAPAGRINTQYGSALIWAYKDSTTPAAGNRQSQHPGLSFFQPTDFGARDFRSLIDFLHSQMPNPCVVDPERFVLYRDSPIAKAIKVNCDGDVKRFRGLLPNGVTELPRFESVMVPLHMPGMVKSTVTWAEFLGLSWDVRPVLSNNDLNATDRVNFHARYLGSYSQVISHHGPFPIACATTERMGSVVVMRRDGGSIHQLHVNWLTAYIDEITKEDGPRLWQLGKLMANGYKVTNPWYELKLNWLRFLVKKHKVSHGRVDWPWERKPRKH